MDQTTIDDGVTRQVFSDITDEIFRAGRIPNNPLIRRLIGFLLKKPVTNFSQFIARIDALVRDYGFVAAAKIAIEELSGGYVARGADTIPADGPLIIASNHPGTYDGFALISSLKREDFKVMVSGIPFFKNLPHASKYLIYSTRDVNDRLQAIRDSIAHLRKGGALLIFPSGRIDPDPAVLPGAEKALSQWSRSILIFMEKVPQVSIVLAITSGVLSEEFVHSFYPRLFKNDHEQRRVMEFLQVIKQMVRGRPLSVNPRVSFYKPLGYWEESKIDPDRMEIEILHQAKSLLKAHKSAFSLPDF